MSNQIKSPKGIKIIAGLMFIMGLIMIIFSIGFPVGTVSFESSEGYQIAMYASFVAAVIFIDPLFIIAGIGLWRIKEWGLFVTLIALGARVFMDVIWTLVHIMFVRVDVTTYDVFRDIITIYIVIFAIISIVYLWKKRRCFYE